MPPHSKTKAVEQANRRHTVPFVAAPPEHEKTTDLSVV